MLHLPTVTVNLPAVITWNSASAAAVWWPERLRCLQADYSIVKVTSMLAALTGR